MKLKEKLLSSVEKPVEMSAISSKPGQGCNSCDSFLLYRKPDINLNQGGNVGHFSQPGKVHKGRDMDQDLNNYRKEAGVGFSSSTNISNHSDLLESGKVVRRALSEGQFPIMSSLSDTLEAAWTGESHPGSIKENGYVVPDSAVEDSSTLVQSVSLDSDLENYAKEGGGIEVARSFVPALPTKGPDNVENSTGWVGMPFLNFYASLNKNSSLNAQKLGTVAEYNPVHVLSFRELERQGGARLLLPVGVNDTVVPVYDDEPTSII
ncbi:hypothetical protein L1049_016122 [Liquidambar formosana]|uniref:Uncharacterized protein n=1 Tax=Liquidambar formosana TaxID=63359 RepID=A0AAP0S034_LIQFO